MGNREQAQKGEGSGSLLEKGSESGLWEAARAPHVALGCGSEEGTGLRLVYFHVRGEHRTSKVNKAREGGKVVMTQNLFKIRIEKTI